jgi:hypothetical protein
MMAQTQERLKAIQARMEEIGVDLAAIGPTANMRFLLGFAPHADERVCLLLLTRQAVCMVAPAVNIKDIAAHTDVELFPWSDADGPRDALRKALPGTGIGSMAIDGPMRPKIVVVTVTSAIEGINERLPIAR